MRTASAQNPSADGCQGVTVPTIIGEGTNRNSSQTHVHGKTLCEMVKDSCANGDCMNDEPVSKLDEMKAVVADSFEDDAHIWGDNTSKPMGSHHHESDENSKLLHSKREDHAKCSECQVGLHDSTKTPDILYDHEKGQYVLSDSLLACLEEEFGGNSDVEQTQVEQQFKEPTNGINNGSSISMDGSDHKNFGNGLNDVCAQAFARHGSAISSNGECLANVLQGPLCSNAHSDTENEKSSVFMTAAESEAKSPLRTEVASVDQNKHKFHGVNYTCRKFDDPLSKSTICRDYDDTEFVGKFVVFESLGEGKHSKDGSQRVNTIAVWPVDDGTKSGKGNPLDKGEECQAGCRNDNENTMMSVSCESNVCDPIPPKGEHIVFHHHPDHDLSNVNHLNDLLSKYPETSARGSDYHLDLMGCYLHPMPVLSITLNTKNNSSLHIYVLCGFLESCQRFLYVYNITPKGQETPPYFVGYTPLQLPSLEQTSTGNFAFGRSGLQFTLDGQFLVLPSSIRIPCCRMQSIDCSCSLCKSDQCEDNSLKIVSVNFGYVSLLTKLVPYGTVLCILICEPNYVVAAEDSRNLHIWMMSTGWSVISEEYVIPSLGNVGPSILELRRMPKSSFLIIGHDGAGGFCLWDFSKRTLLATFAAPGNIVFQILPVGFCSLQEDIIHASVDDIERRLREITVREISGKADKDSILMSPGKDIAIWILVSSASVAEYQHDLRAKEHNARWKLALLANKRVILGNILDPRATVVDASGNCGFAGTYEGLLYTWELSSGRKLAGTKCFNCGRISCIAVDAKSGVVAVADDGCQLLLYTQNKVLSNARAMSTCSG